MKFGSEVHLLTIIDKLPRFTATVNEVKQTIESATQRIEQQHALAHIIAAEHGLEIFCVIQPSRWRQSLMISKIKTATGCLLAIKAIQGTA